MSTSGVRGGAAPALLDRDAAPPARRHDLLISPSGDAGHCVVKDPLSGEYFRLGPTEHFLFSQLDGRQSAGELQASFERQFNEPLPVEDLQQFLNVACGAGLLQSATARPLHEAPKDQRRRAVASKKKAKRPQNILYWRVSLFDPRALFELLAPKLRFVWTRAFVGASLASMAAGLTVAWLNQDELVAFAPRALRWQTLAIAWVVLLAVTTLHEFAHGLTCKHYGGEVREVGFLLMLLMPCFYCNVSDAWLFPEKLKRIYVTLAGGFCDLLVWSWAVLIWRLTAVETTPHYAAWVAISVCGARTFLNFNPLLKLDGYYLLTDWLDIPNLRSRAWRRLMAHCRWLCWGAARPRPEPRGKLLLAYAAASWLFSLALVSLTVVVLVRALGIRLGLAGAAVGLALGVVIYPRFFKNFAQGEFRAMLIHRRKRAAAWALLAAAVPLLATVKVRDRASGPFTLRSTVHAEVRPRTAGFLRAVYVEEGQRVSAGELVGRLEVPDLESRIARQTAALEEAAAELRALETGPRPEEIDEQRCRVERATAWRDLARRDLEHHRRALADDLARLDARIKEARAQREFAAQVLARAKALRGKAAQTEEAYQEAVSNYRQGDAQWQAAQSAKSSRQTVGTLDQEAELELRVKELADAQATLNLLEVGSRPEAIDAGRARFERAKAELAYLRQLEGWLPLTAPAAGIVSTPRLHEAVGRCFKEGQLVCSIDEPGRLEAEIALDEQEVARVRTGLPVELKIRTLPFEVFSASVDRVAPIAVSDSPVSDAHGATSVANPAASQATVAVTCKLLDESVDLRPGMTGYARIGLEARPIGAIALERAMRFLRTEFWW